MKNGDQNNHINRKIKRQPYYNIMAALEHWLYKLAKLFSHRTSSWNASEHSDKEKFIAVPQALFDLSPDVFCIVNKNGHFQQVNKALERITGYSEYELLSKSFIEFVHPDDIEKTNKVFEKQIQEGALIQGFINRYICKDGTCRWLEWASNPISSNGLIYSAAKDITKRIVAESKLNESEALLERFFDQGPFPQWISDGEGTLLRINRACCELLGVKAEDLIGKYNVFKDNIVIEQGAMPIIKSVYEKGETVKFLLKYQPSQLRHIKFTSDVSLILEINVSPCRDANGIITHAIYQHNNMTEQIAAQIALKESENKYRTIFESVNSGILYHDENGAIISANAAAETLIGIQSGQLVGKRTIDLDLRAIKQDGSKFPYDQYPSIVCLRTGKPVHNVLMGIFNHLNGDYRWIVVSSVPEFRENETKPSRVFSAFDDVTMIVKAEKSLKESEERYRTLHENVGVGIFRIKKDGHFISANSALLNILGDVPLAEIYECKLTDFYTDEIEKAKLLDALYRNDEVIGYKAKVKRKNGGCIWISTGINAIKNTMGETLYFDGYCQDITKLVETETALRERQRRLSALVSNMPGMVYSCHNDKNRTMEFVSEGVYELTGYTPEDFINNNKLSFNDIIYPEDRAKVQQTVQEALARKKMFRLEYRINTTDGQIRWVYEQGIGIFSQDGIPEILEGLIINITDRKRAEIELQESEDKFYKAFQSSPLMMAITTIEEGRLLEVNDTFCQTFNTPKFELIGKTTKEMNFFVDYGQRLHIRDEIISKGFIRGYEVIMNSPNGEQRVCLFYAYKIRLHGQDYILSVLNDITERIQAEKQLKESEDKFSKAFYMSPVMMAITTIDEGRIIEVNDTFCQAIGKPKPEIIGKTTKELDLFADYDQRLHIKEEIESKGFIRDYDVNTNIKSDKYRICIYSAYRIRLHGEDFILSVLDDITERKKAEELLHKEKSKAQSYLDLAGVIMLALDKDGIITLINKKGCAVLGMAEKDIVGKNWYNTFIPENDRAEMTALHNKIFAGEIDDAEYYENMIVTSSGEKRLIAWHNVIHRDETGIITSVLSSGEDITDRKRAESQLKESEEKFVKAFQLSPVVMLISTVEEGRIIEASDTFCRVLNMSKFEIIGKTTKELEIFDDYNQRLHIMAEIKSKGFLRNYDIKINPKVGGSRICIYSAYRIRLHGEDFILSVLDDITERKQAEELLKKEKNKAQSYLDIAGVIIIALDKDGIITLINKKGCAVLGMTEKEIIGKNWYDTFIPEDDKAQMIGVHNKIFTGEIDDAEYYESMIVTSSGEKRLIAWHNVIHRDETGIITSVLSSGEDITDRKRAEIELKESEDKFVKAFKLSPVLMAISTIEDGRLIEVNEAFCSNFGLTEAEIIGKTTAELKMYSDSEQRAKILKIIMEKGFVKDIEIDIDGKGGVHRKGLFYAEKICTNNREYLLTVFNDITERLQAEELFRREKSKAQNYLDIAGVIMVALDKDGFITLINKKGCAVLGMAEEEIIGKNWYDTFVPDSDKEESRTIHSRIFSGKFKNPGYYEKHIITASGEKRLIAWHDVIHRDENGNIASLLGSGEDITERRKVEIERDRLFNYSVDLLCIGNFEGYFIQVNPAWTKTLGWSHEELLAKPWLDFIHPDDREATKQTDKILLGEKASVDFENRFQCHDGSYRWISWNAIPVPEEKIVYAIARDITEKKQREQALAESELKFRSIIQSSPMGMHMYELQDDGKLVFIGANDAADTILGIRHEDLIGKTIEEAFPGLIGTEIPDIYRRIAKTHDSWNAEQSTYNEGGVKGIYEVRAFQTSSNKMVAMFLDITKRKQIEDALAAEKERLMVTLRSIGDAVITTDTKSQIMLFNKVAEELTGYKESEAIGRELNQVFNIINELTRKPVDNPVEKVLEKGIAVDLANHTILIAKDGREKAIADSGAPIRNKQGRVIGVVLVFRDVTRAMRTQELLSRAQRLEAAGTVAGQIAHDFNNLLGPLIAYPQFIKDLLEHDHPGIGYLEKMEDAASQIAEINQQLLTLGRRGYYVQEPLNLNNVVEQVINEIVRSNRKVKIETHLQDDLLAIKGGAAQILRVVDNIVNNACDAMSDTGCIMLKTENYYADRICERIGRVPEGEYVKLTISDTGAGIPAEIQGRIFEPFFTTKKADKKRGSGLGLSIVHSVMDDHSAFIDLNSAPGAGTTFYLYFPISREEIKDEDGAEIIQGTGKVLIVDDDRLQREVNNAMLIKLGYQTVVVGSGEQALQYLQENQVDLMLLDMVMQEGMDGLETYRRALNIAPSLKAIIISGSCESSHVHRAFKLGISGYIRKPVKIKTLSKVVAEALHKAPVAG